MNYTEPPRKVLILGAAGHLGRELVRAYAQAGWQVVAQIRSGKVVETWPAGVEVVAAPLDAQGLAQIARAASGAGSVVHALNPAYCNLSWQRSAPALMEVAIELARRLNARLLFPGNVYNFGSEMPEVLVVDTPQAASDAKGRVRIALEARLRDAVAEGGLRATVIRAGDFFGGADGHGGGWFERVLAKDLWRGRMAYPGALDVDHAWAYLPDLAQTFVRVGEHEPGQADFEVLHFAGHTLRGSEWQAGLTRIAGSLGWLPKIRALRVGGMPWSLLRLIRWCSREARAVGDMRHLWQRPHRLDNQGLEALIGHEPHTPFVHALRASVARLYPHVLEGGATSASFGVSRNNAA